jgi:formate/nitrite transporter FocA (FNT family)
VLTCALHVCAADPRRFLIPLGIALGADLTFSQFIFQNLIPVTLGNIVGGLVFMVSAGCCVVAISCKWH